MQQNRRFLTPARFTVAGLGILAIVALTAMFRSPTPPVVELPPFSWTILKLLGLVWSVSIAAGFLGSLTGLGGGVVIVPLLTLVFGVDIRFAIGASLVSVIATSSGAAAAYVRDGYTNVRIGLFLEIGTTMGALVGASVVTLLPTGVVAVIFGTVLFVSAYQSSQQADDTPFEGEPDRLAEFLELDGSYPGPTGPISYTVGGVIPGFVLVFVAGALSGLLGIGSGAVKVLAMDRAMRIPFKVSTTTSNFMIGVTAAASAGVYLNHGYIDPGLAMAVMLGVLPGALIGARFLATTQTRVLRLIFSVVIVVLAIQMIYYGATGRI